MKKVNVYIIGRVQGFSRTENLVKFFLDKRANLFYNSTRLRIFEGETGWKRIIRKILLVIELLMKRIVQTYFLYISSLVILPAMCNKFQFELRIAKFFRKKIITDFYISEYDTYVLDRKTVSPKSFKGKLLKAYDVFSINSADFTLFLNKSEAYYYLNLLDIPFNPLKHRIVPLCIEKKNKCKLKYFKNKSSEVFNICWWGSYIPLHGLEKIIEAVKVLEKYNFNFQLYLFGTNEKRSRPYKELVKRLELQGRVNINNHYTFQNGKLPSFLQSHCTLVLGNFGDSTKAKNVLVNKVIDGTSMRAPVLTGESIAPLEFFTTNDIYYCKNSPEAIAEKIFEISQENHAVIYNRVDQAFTSYEKNFSVTAYQRNMQSVLSELVV